MIKDHSDNKTGNLLLPLNGLLFPISSKGSFICNNLNSAYQGHCYTSYGILAGMRNSSVSALGGMDPTTHCTVSGCSTVKLYITP